MVQSTDKLAAQHKTAEVLTENPHTNGTEKATIKKSDIDGDLVSKPEELPYIVPPDANHKKQDTKQSKKPPTERGNSVAEISFFNIKKTKNVWAISLSRVRFIDFYHSNAVGLFFIDEKNYTYAKLTEWFFQEITTEYLRKLALSHINSLPEAFDCGITRTELLEYFLKGSDTFFSRSFLEFLNRFNPDYLQDTSTTGFIPFKNGVVCVTRDNIELKPYNEVKKHLWKDSVIDFEITIDDYKLDQGVWYKFLSCINGNPDPSKLTKAQADNFHYLLCLTGYFLHKYKDPTRPFAGILAEQTESEDKGGGTGKGLYTRGISQVASVCTIAGKTFDPLARFAWQRLQLHNTIAVIDDVPKKFALDGLYNCITEGITREQKNQQEIFIPYASSPKIIVISNYVISSTGNHAARRQKVFEFMPFFTPQYTPQQHFGHVLFDEWDHDEWNRFYHLQITCLMMYLKDGLQESEKSDILKRREVRQKFGDEFASWFFDDYTQNGCEKPKGVTELYTDFLKYAEIEKEECSVKRFRAGIVYGSCTLGHDFKTGRNKDKGNRVEIWVVKKK